MNDQYLSCADLSRCILSWAIQGQLPDDISCEVLQGYSQAMENTVRVNLYGPDYKSLWSADIDRDLLLQSVEQLRAYFTEKFPNVFKPREDPMRLDLLAIREQVAQIKHVAEDALLAANTAYDRVCKLLEKRQE